jgi:two-component system NarL family response regulator
MRILLVDDHPLFVEGLRDLLVRRGIDVAGIAPDGLDALEKARTLHPDVILMDIQMPRCDGLAATRLIKAEMPQVQIVMLTMSGDDEQLFEAIRSGASGYLLKSLPTEEFFSLLIGLERGEAPFGPGIAARVLGEFARLSAQASAQETAAAQDVQGLTPRQMQVLALLSQGLLYKEIGAHLGLTERTVKYHMGEVLQKLHLQNRAEVVAYARRRGLLS